MPWPSCGTRQGEPASTKIARWRVTNDKWTEELLANNAIIGIWVSMCSGLTNMTITEGILDCAVDSLSRIKAILGAADNPLGSFNLDTRFQVRIWLLDDAGAKKVATIYNTRGDKVNDSTAKYAYSETKEQELARRLVNGSEHLGQDNIEVLSNSVAASSHKLTAFNTISRALETSWKGGPVTAADIEAQSSWLISAWDSLAKIRPEFGTPARPPAAAQEQPRLHRRGHLWPHRRPVDHVRRAHRPGCRVQGSRHHRRRSRPPRLGQPRLGARRRRDPAGTDSGTVGTRNSFPARRAATRVLQEIMGLDGDPDD